MCCARGNLWYTWLTVPGSWSTFNKLPAARTALHFTCSKDGNQVTTLWLLLSMPLFSRRSRDQTVLHWPKFLRICHRHMGLFKCPNVTLIVYSITYNNNRRIVYLTTWCSGMHLQQGILYSSILLWYSRTDMVPQGLSWLLAPSQCLLWTWLFPLSLLISCDVFNQTDVMGGSSLY